MCLKSLLLTAHVMFLITLALKILFHTMEYSYRKHNYRSTAREFFFLFLEVILPLLNSVESVSQWHLDFAGSSDLDRAQQIAVFCLSVVGEWDWRPQELGNPVSFRGLEARQLTIDLWFFFLSCEPRISMQTPCDLESSVKLLKKCRLSVTSYSCWLWVCSRTSRLTPVMTWAPHQSSEGGWAVSTHTLLSYQWD